MNGSMDANELAAQLLEGLDTLEVGPMMRSEFARRLAERGLAAPPPSPPVEWQRRFGTGPYRGAFLRAIEVASRGEVRVEWRFIRWTPARSGPSRLSYSGTGQSRWDEVIGRCGPKAFADRVLQVLEGEVGGGFVVGFGLGRTDARTISLVPADVAGEGCGPG